MRWGFGVGAAVFLLGCVNGDDSTGIPPGSLGGPCLSNGTCNTGLTCALENGKGVCEQPDATLDAPPGGDGSDDQTVADSPVDSPNDGGTAEAGQDADAGCTVTLATTTPCGNCGNAECCPTDGTCHTETPSQCLQGSCANVTCFDCVGSSTCSGNNYCCAPNAVLQPTCPPVVSINSGTQCSANCSGVNVCVTSSDCPGGKTCVGASVQDFVFTSIGACQ